MTKIINKEWEELKEKFNREVVTVGAYYRIIETENVYVDNNGNSGTDVTNIWYTAVLKDEDEDEDEDVIDEFDFYINEDEDEEDEDDEDDEDEDINMKKKYLFVMPRGFKNEGFYVQNEPGIEDFLGYIRDSKNINLRFIDASEKEVKKYDYELWSGKIKNSSYNIVSNRLWGDLE